MTLQPTVIVAGEPMLAKALSKARHPFPHILTAETSSALLGLAEDPRVTGADALCYILSTKLDLDIDNVTLELIGSELSGAGHSVLVVGNTPEGAALAKQRGWPLVRPKMNLVQVIQDVSGPREDIDPTPPAPASPPAPPAPPADPTPTPPPAPAVQPPKSAPATAPTPTPPRAPTAPPAPPAPPAVDPVPTPPPAPAMEPPATPAPPDEPVVEEPIDNLQASLGRANRWSEAQFAARTSKSRELAPVEGSRDNWDAAVSLARKSGSHDLGNARRGYILAFAARKGGVGKTTLAVNSAAFLAKQLENTGKRVCLVDMNLQQSDVGKYLGRERPNVTSLISRPHLLQPDQIEEALVEDPKRNLWALLGPSTIGESNPTRVNTELYKQAIEVLQQQFDYIIIDTPVAERYHQVLDYVLPNANFIIVPVTPNRVTLGSVREWMDEITKPQHAGGYGIEPTKLGMVLNKAKLNIHCDPTDVEDMMSSYPWLGMLPDSDAWQAAENTGKLIGSAPGADLHEAFRHMMYAATRAPELKTRVREKIIEQQKAKLPWWKTILGRK